MCTNFTQTRRKRNDQSAASTNKSMVVAEKTAMTSAKKGSASAKATSSSRQRSRASPTKAPTTIATTRVSPAKATTTSRPNTRASPAKATTTSRPNTRASHRKQPPPHSQEIEFHLQRHPPKQRLRTCLSLYVLCNLELLDDASNLTCILSSCYFIRTMDVFFCLMH